jgi:4-amino-4-deoxy-L-arabinose transferase-like glycosyltransferase
MSSGLSQLTSPQARRTLAGLFLAALALRLLIFGVIAHEPRKFYTYDSDGYDRRAMNILRYGEFASEGEPPRTPDLDRTPVYPLYLAAVFGSVGHQPWVAILLQVIIGSLTAVLTYLLARELRLSHLAAFVGGLIVALDPVSAMNANRLLTETIFTTLIVASIYALARYLNSERLSWALGAAVLLALASLTRPIAQFLPIAVLPLFVVVLRRAGWKRALLGALILLGVSLPLTYSWAYRNYRQAGVFTLSTISDTNLVYYRARAVLAEVNGISQDDAWVVLEEQVARAAGPGASPSQVVAAQRQIAIDTFRSYPGLTLKMLVFGVARIVADPGYTITCTLLDPSSTSFDCFPGKSTMNDPGLIDKALSRVGAMSAIQILALALSAVVLACLYGGAAIGLVRLLRERDWLTLGVTLLLIGYFVGLSAGAESNSRFRIPALPFMAILAGAGWAALRVWGAAWAAPGWPRRTSIGDLGQKHAGQGES